MQRKCTDEDILNFIRAYHERKGYAPTNREIGAGCGLVVSAMSYRLKNLHKRGDIEMEPRIARSIRVVE